MLTTKVRLCWVSSLSHCGKKKKDTAKFLRCWEDIFYLFSSAMRLFFLPRVYSFCPEVNSFAVTVGWTTVHLKFCSRRFLIFFNMWVFVRTTTNFAHLVSFHYSSHRIHRLACSENAGHFWMSDKWKQIFQNAAFCNCCLRRTNLWSGVPTFPLRKKGRLIAG